MGRTLPVETQQKLNDKDWLIETHCINLVSVGEISKILGCTPAVITRAIKRHQIKTPSQQQLRQASLQRKYGVSNVSNVPEFRSKALTKLLTKQGIQDRKEKREATNIKKYGVTNSGGLPQFKSSRTGRNRHITTDVLDLLNDPQWIRNEHHTNKKSLTEIAQDIGVNMSTVMIRCHKFNIEVKNYFQSSEEKSVVTYVRSVYDGVISERDRSLGFEVDILIPDKQIAIEYCGLFWHSEQCGKDRWYHHKKYIKCKQAGIQLLTIFADEWKYKSDIVKRMVYHKMSLTSTKIYGRTTTVSVIDPKQAAIFLDQYHIQGNGGGSVHLALQDTSSIVAVMQFKNTSRGWLLNRYATSAHVVGGASKLFQYFIKTYNPCTVFTFADHRLSNGKLYDVMGATSHQVLPPDYCYSGPGCNGRRIHKFNFRHKFLNKRIPNYNSGLTEFENCDNAKLWRIWDCGKTKYTWEFNT